MSTRLLDTCEVLNGTVKTGDQVSILTQRDGYVMGEITMILPEGECVVVKENKTGRLFNFPTFRVIRKK